MPSEIARCERSCFWHLIPGTYEDKVRFCVMMRLFENGVIVASGQTESIGEDREATIKTSAARGYGLDHATHLRRDSFVWIPWTLFAPQPLKPWAVLKLLSTPIHTRALTLLEGLELPPPSEVAYLHEPASAGAAEG